MGKLTRISLLLVGALAAWGLWLAEVCWIKGWTGLAWLWGFNWSALPICALILITASYALSTRVAWRERMIFTAVGWVIALSAFMLARWAAFDLFSRDLGLLPTVRWEAFLAATLAVLLLSGGLTFAANRWLAAMHYWTWISALSGLASGDATVDRDDQDTPCLERQHGRDPLDQDGLPRVLDCRARSGCAASWAQEAAIAACGIFTEDRVKRLTN
jgi:hypothetical protein